MESNTNETKSWAGARRKEARELEDMGDAKLLAMRIIREAEMMLESKGVRACLFSGHPRK